MDQKELKDLLGQVAEGSLSPESAFDRLRIEPFTDLGYAKVDNLRGVTQGSSEVVYGQGKSAEQIAGIVGAMRASREKRILITRLSPDKAAELARIEGFSYDETARIAVVGEMPAPDGLAYVVVACAGTSDLPVAEEAAKTAMFAGSEVRRLYDVGVAGLHRLLAHADDIAHASAIVVVAGMEGALASVVAGMASCPVVAVPTSVGYGASFGGLAALLSMLNSCANGVSVVNIDNGYGAGCQAAMIDHVAPRRE